MFLWPLKISTLCNWILDRNKPKKQWFIIGTKKSSPGFGRFRITRISDICFFFFKCVSCGKIVGLFRGVIALGISRLNYTTIHYTHMPYWANSVQTIVWSETCWTAINRIYWNLVGIIFVRPQCQRCMNTSENKACSEFDFEFLTTAKTVCYRLVRNQCKRWWITDRNHYFFSFGSVDNFELYIIRMQQCACTQSWYARYNKRTKKEMYCIGNQQQFISYRKQISNDV